MEVSERDRRSLKDLANEATAPAKPKTKSVATPDSSGFVDLAALAATDPDWLEQAVARAKKAHVAIAEKQESEEIVVDEAALGLPRKRAGARKIAIGLVAFAALGVATMVFAKTRHPEPPPLVVSAPASQAPVAAAPAPAPVPTDIPAPPAADEAASAGASTDAPPAEAKAEASDTAMELPATPAATGKKGSHGRTARAHGGAPAQSEAAPAPAPPTPKGAQPKFLAGIVPASAPAPAPAAGPGGALGDAMKQASGARSGAPAAKAAPAPAAPPPVANTTGLPDRPPTSAVQSAIKAQLSSARACLHAGDPDMHVTIVFGSSGSPKSIQATGPGASCVQSAFSRTRVPPFAQPTTSAGFTVRPN